MQGLPDTVDLAPLVEEEVSQLCFSQHQFIINFASDKRIAVESGSTYSPPAGPSVDVTSYPEVATALCGLLGKSIRTASRDAQGGMELSFSDGSGLHIRNDNDGCESFQVHIPPHVYVA